MYFVSIFFSSFVLRFGLVLIFGIYLFILFNKSDHFKCSIFCIRFYTKKDYDRDVT